MRRQLVAVLLVLTGGAVIVPGMASATVWVGQTNLTIHVKGSAVDGRLVGRPECRPAQDIQLLVNGVVADVTTTDSSGAYAFTYAAALPVDLQTRFAGTRTGEHPDRFICEASQSRIVVVTKTHGPGGAALELARQIRAVERSMLRSFHSAFRA